MRFSAALSEHPLPTHAAGETVGQLLEELDGPPDLVVVFATAPLAGALEDITRTIRSVLNPRVLVGSTAVSVLGGSREVEDVAALALFGACFGVDVTPIRLEAFPGAGGGNLIAGGGELAGGGTLLTVSDPFSFPIEDVLAAVGETVPDLAVFGGMASAARGPGGNVLLLDDEQFRDGAVGALLPPSVPVTPVISQGCRPFGQPFVVTRSERNMVYELGGRPAVERLNEQLEGLSADDRHLLGNGLHAGIAIDERRLDLGRGDFLVRGVLGADRASGALALGAEVEVGTTVQFQLRDAVSADEDLRHLMADRTAGGALVFTCNGRGSRLFGVPDHDAEVVSESLGAAAVAGMFCAGEFGPVGGRNFVHGQTASIALFGSPS